MRPSLEIGFACRSAMLARRCNDALILAQEREPGVSVATLIALAEELDRHIKNCEGSGPEWMLMAISLRVLASQLESRQLAKKVGQGMAEQHARLAVLTEEAKEASEKITNRTFREQFVAALGGLAGSINIHQLLNNLLRLPLPTNYRVKPKEQFGRRHREKPGSGYQNPSLVKVTGFLDGTALVAPNLVKQNTVYTLEFQITGEHWPNEADMLEIDFLTTCPRDLFSVSEFRFGRPAQRAKYDTVAKGQILFRASQSILAEPIMFELRCAFIGRDKKTLAVGAIGYTRIHFRVDDPNDTRLQSGHKHMDLHIANLLRDLTHNCASIKLELDQLVPVLEALASIVGSYALDGDYKGISQLAESEFHKRVRKDLRIRLGNELQDHPNQAGGTTDLRYRGVVIELKVEERLSDRKELAQKYCAQLAQYEGAEARQVGVLLVLDLSPKILPPGDVRNDILLVDVPTHGGSSQTKTHPSKAFVFVINGNTRNPSTYSKG